MADGVEQLRSIYDLCNPDTNDHIIPEILVDQLSGQFDDDLLERIKGTLDPKKKGKITFEDFCSAITNLHSIPDQQHGGKEEEESLSDPEFTYNEYDIAEDEELVAAGDMENYEAFGESLNTLSPISREGNLNGMRNSNFRKSHRRNKSWAPQAMAASSHVDDSSSVSSEIDDLTEKVDILQSTVLKLTEEKAKQSNHESFNHENQTLTSRVHELEEKLHDASESFSELQVNSSKKLENLRSKLQREKELEIQVLQGQVDMLTRENERVQRDTNELASSRNELKDEVKSLRKMTEDLTQQLVETNEQYRKLSLQFAQQQEKHDSERRQTKDELSELCMQMDALQRDKHELEDRLEAETSAGDGDAAARGQMLDRLRGENERLRAANDDLEAQLAHKLSDVRSIIHENVPGVLMESSLADELKDASKDDVMEQLRKQEQLNRDLNAYMSKVLQNIIENAPELLEIQNAADTALAE